jgi:N-acetylmuramoyl-L-alanine amidase
LTVVRALRFFVFAGLIGLALVGVMLRPPSGEAQPTTANAYLVLNKEGRQPLPVTVLNGHEMFSLDDIARFFATTVREDQVARGLVVTVQGKTITLSGTQGLASIGGRVVSLSAPPAKSGSAWFVPTDFIDRALASVYEPKLDVRARSRLIVVGDVRVPRVAVRVDAQGAQTRLIVDIAPPTTHSVVQEPGRLIIRFDADALDAELPTITPSEVLRAAHVTPNAPAIGIDLGPRFNTFRTNDAPIDANQTRLTIELISSETTITSTPPPATPSPFPPPAPNAAPARPPIFGENAPLALRTIVLDPGHGGEKEGAHGPGGSLEKHVTLAIAKQLKTALEAKLGVRVLLTREDDRLMELDERAAFANNNKADVFVSLHANASVRSTITGASVYYLSLSDYTDEARRVAISENGGALPTIQGGDRQVELILWEMAQVQHIEQSAALAGIIERQLGERVKMNSRAIQQAPFYVLVGANMPAVLVEMGFISNPGDEKQLNTPSYQQAVVASLVASMVQFREYLEGRRTTAPRTPAPVGAPRPTAPQAATPQRQQPELPQPEER